MGDEGGFAPDLASDVEAIQYILQAIESAGYIPGKDFVLALDAAASEWKGHTKGEYILPKRGQSFTTDELIAHWKQLSQEYPIYSIEDGLDEEDWEGWAKLTNTLGKRVQLVGDDLFVTNTKRLQKVFLKGAAMPSSSSSTRSVPYRKLWMLSSWLIVQAIGLSYPIAPGKRKTHPLPIWQSP